MARRTKNQKRKQQPEHTNEPFKQQQEQVKQEQNIRKIDRENQKSGGKGYKIKSKNLTNLQIF